MTDNSYVKANVNEKWIVESPAGANLEGGTRRDTVDTPSQEWYELEKERPLVRVLLGGTEDMQAGGKKWLPVWEGEEGVEYKTRLSLSELVEFYAQACRGLVNKVFAKPLRLSDAPEKLEAWWDNVSRKKTERSGSLYVRGRSLDSLSRGLGFTLVDFPKLSAPVEDAKQEEQQALAPYCKTIPPSCVIEWDEGVNDLGDVVLRRVRYADVQEVDSTDEWIKHYQPIVVVLERGEGEGQPATMQVHVREEGSRDFKHDPEQDAAFEIPLKSKLGEIPAVRWETGASGGEPILYGLARLNLQHYRKKSDFDHAVSISSQPMQAYIGFSDDDMEGHQVGAYRYVNTTNDAAKVQDISFQYSGSAQIAMEDLSKLELHIARAALDPQATKATGEEKATIRLIDEAKVSSQLQAWAAGWLDSAQEVLEWAGAWYGLEPEAVGTLSYLEEIFDSLKGESTFADFLSFAALFVVPPEVAIKEAQRFGVIGDEHDPEDLARRMDVSAGEVEP